MKRINTLPFLITLACFFIISRSSAQSSAYASVGATIMSPITLEQESDLELVRLNGADGEAGGLGQDLITPASFSVSGSPHSVYGVLVPPAVSVARGSDIITMRTAATNASGNGVLSESGKDDLLISSTPMPAAREMAMASEEGQGTLPVTVVYN